MTASATLSTSSWKSTFAAAGIAALGAVAANSVIALIARGPLDAPAEFQPLTPGPYVTFTILGVLISAIAWRLIVNRSSNATSLLRKLVPTVVVVSLIPDVLLLVNTEAQPGITTAGVIALMLMHVAVAVIAVPLYRRFMPPKS